MDWQPINTAPKHIEVLLYRQDSGVWLGQFTSAGEFLSAEEAEREECSDAELWQDDFWYFDHNGAHRCEGELRPTHWMPLPQPPTT